ncbi:MAG: hypothetical protein SFT90_05805 [Rickettsiales bacterium]|nr:hypothetical protein [Rickettsiales bacterium]
MKKFRRLILLVLAVLEFLPMNANADWTGPDDGSGYWGPPFCHTRPADFTGICMGEPEEFSFDIKKFRLRKASDQTFFDLSTATQTFDFASASAGTQLGNYVSGVAVPAGTYDAMSFVAGVDIVIRGSVALDGGSGPTCRTAPSGISTDGGAAQDFVASNNNTPLFDVITSGSDEVEGAATGGSLEINYINTDGDLVFVGNTIGGVSFPITINDGNSLTFNFSMRPVKGIVFEFINGVCQEAFSGDMQIAISANVL